MELAEHKQQNIHRQLVHIRVSNYVSEELVVRSGRVKRNRCDVARRFTLVINPQMFV